MNQPKPPPHTLQPDDERKIQIFLERASSIVLENPVLDLVHWRRLVSLAEELALSDEELRSTVNDLRQRGVISEIDLSPPKPPPLPRQPGKPAPDDQPAGPEQDFSLTPPAPPPASVPTGSPAVSTSATSNTDTQRPQPPTGQRGSDRSQEERVGDYLERAQAIIAEQRGFGARAQALLTALADELGLSDQEAASALRRVNRSVESPPPPPSSTTQTRQTASAGEPESESDEALQDHRRWRVAGAPPPEPPPPTRRPEAIFRDYLSASLAHITDGIVPAVLEQKLIKHGTSVLGLAQVFARHLVYEEGAEKHLRFESEGREVDSDATHPTVPETSELCDTNVKLFLERSAPILAQHRGINAKSRVLLNALAAELGLTDERVERAIAALQFRSTTPRQDADAQQQERLEGFRELVQGALISLPRKLLTFDIEANLRRHGEERHGIKPALVANVLREVCVALGLRQISEQQAREHIEQLVDAKLGEDARLPSDVRARVESEGKQWGLATEQVAAIIKERTRLHDKRNQSERNFTHGALLAVGLAALIVAGFFGWVAIQGSPAGPSSEVPGNQLRLPVPIAVDDANVDTAWWGDELAFAVSAARREMRARRPMLIQIESKAPGTRRAAYGQLVEALFDQGQDDEQRDLLMHVISLCYAREPDQEAARRLLDGLIARIPRSERQLRADDALYEDAFLASRAAVDLVTEASDGRQSDASTELGRAVGRTIDRGLDRPLLLEHAYEGVAERLYRLLIALAKSEPALVASEHAAIAEQAEQYLDSNKLEKLNTDFLVVVLSRASHTWRQYESLLRETIASKSPIVVIRMVDVYEKTDDPALQAMLGDALIERIGKAPESREVAVVASAVRKALGVATGDLDNKRLARFLLGAKGLLDEPRVDISEPEALLAEIVNLAYYSTLGCAVAQGSAGDAKFDALAEQDPAAFLTPDGPSVPFDRDEPTPLEPTTLRMLNERLGMLLNPRISPVTRFGFVETIAGFTSRIDDLAPDQAAALATYLLGKKRIEEHRAILTHVEALGKWKQLRLAVADQLAEAGVSNEQLQEIISQLLGREYEVASGSAGREALRVTLLHDVLVDVKKADVGQHDRHRVYDDAAQALYDLYTAQAISLESAGWSTEPITPTVVARVMIESRVKELLEAAPATEVRNQLQQIEADARAIDYLATSDLQKLVLLDRAWLRLLAVDVARKRPSRSAEAEAIVEQLAIRDRDAEHVLVQLRDGNAGILRMWLLLNQPD